LRFIISLLILVVLFSSTTSWNKNDDVQLEIAWFKDLKGDFSFKKKWDFAENVGLNSAQQIVCLSQCSNEVLAMIDKNGLIKVDSIDAYYKIVDSTRKYHTIESRCSIDACQPSNFIRVKKYGNFTIEAQMIGGSNRNCSLILRMKDNHVSSWIYVKGNQKAATMYKLNGGKIFIDEPAFEKGILKATFSFTYENDNNGFKALFWSGKIYSKIEGY